MKQIFLVSGLCLVVLTNLYGQKNEETTIGNSYYDLQTWRTMQNRIYNFPDGTIGAVWNMGNDFPQFNDLGIGYNYFNGNAWGSLPYQSITPGWAVNPSYTAYGENGEICVSQGMTGLILSIRAIKGSGTWQHSYLTGAGYQHPVVVTTGVNHEIIHLLYLIADDSFVPTNAQPSRGSIWYARSADGGATWDINTVVPGLGNDQYLGFTIGSYCWAEPENNILAFLTGDFLTDLVLMKSSDEGETWEKKVIWEHPYPFFEIFTFNSEYFYCNGGGMGVAIDNNGMVHVAFGLSRVFSTTLQDTLWCDKYADGIVYWREDMPGFKNTLNSLHPDTLSICDNYIGWSQDVNGNGLYEIEPTIYPALGNSTWPSLTFTNYNQLILIYSSGTETFSNGDFNYRHLWARIAAENCQWSNFVDLTSDLIHIFDECVYPAAASFSDDYFHLLYSFDTKPGPSLPGGIPPFTENQISHMKVPLYYFKENGEKSVFVDFKINQDSIFEGDTVFFSNLSCGCPFPYSYSWEFEAGIPDISTDIHPAIVYPNAGVYDVSLMADNGVNIVTEYKPDYITVYPYADVNAVLDQTNITISPNPGSGLFKIILPQTNPGHPEIAVFDVIGKVIEPANIIIKRSSISLDVTNQENGIYFVKINQGNKNYLSKIAVQK